MIRTYDILLNFSWDKKKNIMKILPGLVHPPGCLPGRRITKT